jgi:hypothetical protein
VASRGNERSAERDRALSFGSVAELYERYRLDYPEEAVDAVVRADALHRIRAALPDHLDVDATVHLVLARRV